jgi:hypothetical protein
VNAATILHRALSRGLTLVDNRIMYNGNHLVHTAVDREVGLDLLNNLDFRNLAARHGYNLEVCPAFVPDSQKALEQWLNKSDGLGLRGSRFGVMVAQTGPSQWKVGETVFSTKEAAMASLIGLTLEKKGRSYVIRYGDFVHIVPTKKQVDKIMKDKRVVGAVAAGVDVDHAIALVGADIKTILEDCEDNKLKLVEATDGVHIIYNGSAGSPIVVKTTSMAAALTLVASDGIRHINRYGFATLYCPMTVVSDRRALNKWLKENGRKEVAYNEQA